MATKWHRELARRQHRVLAHYLALIAWVRGADCVAIERSKLETLLDLERFKEERLRWLAEDAKPWFDHHQLLYSVSSPGKFQTVWLSRVTLPAGVFSEQANVKRRVEILSAAGIRATFIGDQLREDEIVGALAHWAAGIGVPK